MRRRAGSRSPAIPRKAERSDQPSGACAANRRSAVAALALSEDDMHLFRPMFVEELLVLDLCNYARYRLSMEQVQEWIDAGRPQ